MSVVTDPDPSFDPSVPTTFAGSQVGGSKGAGVPISPTGDLGKNGAGLIDPAVLGEMSELGFETDKVKRT